MATTINHKFSIPEKFDSDYADTFDTFFEQIDRDVAITDTESNVTDYEPKTDAKFLASDTGVVYIGDGSSWSKIASSGNSPTFNSVTVEEQLDIPIYSDDTNAPNETTYYNDTDSTVKYKDASGSIIVPTGLQSGEDFDGEDTSDFINIASIDVTDATVSNSPSDSNDVAIKEYVDSVTQGLNWQQPIIVEQNDPPASPSEGDRYLIDDAPTGAWDTHPNEITEYINGVWEFYPPDEGWAVFVESSDILKVFNNSDWVEFGSAIDHGALSGLNDDDHTQYLLVDGTRAMSGSLDMGSNAITNATDITASGTTESGTYTVDGSTIAQSVVDSGQVTLSSGEATVDTGISAVNATFTLALGVDDPNADVDLAGRLFWDDSAGTYKIDIVEATTSVGNPTANYDVVRVR